jgi:hypothetical protein
VILIAALFSDSYDTFLGYKIPYEGYRFLISIPFMYFGIVFSKKSQLHIPMRWVLTAIALGIVSQIIEAQMFETLYSYNKQQHQILIGTLLIVVPLFYLGINVNFKENKLSSWGREHSLFIYLYHPLVYFVLNFLLKKTVSVENVWPNLLMPVIGFILILGISVFFKTYFSKFYNFLNGDLSFR